MMSVLLRVPTATESRMLSDASAANIVVYCLLVSRSVPLASNMVVVSAVVRWLC